MSVPVPVIENIVTSFHLGVKEPLDLATLPLRVPMAHFTPNFAAARIALTEPKTTCLVFASGKAVCTGAKSAEEAITACGIYVNMLRRFGLDVTFTDFHVHNIVCRAHCPFRVDLRNLANSDTSFNSYEKGLFPGLSHKAVVPGTDSTITFLVFVSGGCVITGGTDEQLMLQAWNKFYFEDLVRFKCPINYGSSGNYRMSQNLFSDPARDWMHQQMVHTSKTHSELTGDDMVDMFASVTQEMQITQLILQEIEELDPANEPTGEFVYQPC